MEREQQPNVSPAAEIDVAEESHTTPASDSTASISWDRIGLVDERLHLEPEHGSWTVEIFNERAGKQLKLLQKLLQSQRSFERGDVEGYVAPGFHCSRLRASDLRTVFQDDAIRVQRPGDSPLAMEFAGAGGFAQALTEMLEPFANATERRATFKISRVNDERTATEATVEFQFVGRSNDSVMQQSSQWQCVWTNSEGPDTLPRLQSIVTTDTELSSGTAPKLFADCTESVLGQNPSFREQLVHGVDHWLDRIEHRFGISASGWQGLALGDVNGDGLDDLYVCQSGGLPNRLFVQRPDGTAEDTSAAAGVDWWDHSHAALLLDLDNDADQDLVVATTLGLIWMSNDGQGRFSVETTKLCPEAMPFTLAAADFDNDGDIDLYASCYSPRGNAITTEFLARPVPYHDANNGGRNCLFRNDRNWRFTNATRQVGLDQNNRRFSLAAAWEDYDNDGDQDLYVANDYGRNNLYRNEDGHFVDVARAAGVEDISAGMSVSWGDYNRDGQMDLYVSNMWSSAGNRITYQREFQPSAAAGTRADFQRHARGNSLFMNNGDGTFRDVSVEADVTMGRWAWGSRFLDMNNDSLEDIVVTNGFITQEDTGDL